MSPFDDFRSLAAGLPPLDDEARAACRDVLAKLEDPSRLGRLAATAEQMAAIQGKPRPQVNRPIIALYAAAHDGVAGDSPKQRLDALAQGKGAISALARAQGAGVEVFDLAADRPCPDAATGPTMTEREAAATMAFGMEALAKNPDLLILGEAALGAERAAGAIAFALHGGAVHDWCAPAEAAWTTSAVARGSYGADGDPLQLMRQLGGRETAALVGAILAAGTQRTPVILDGYAAAAAAAILQILNPQALSHCIAGQVSPAAGHARLLERLNLTPLLDLEVAGREGLGGAAAIGVVRLACALAAGD